MNKGTNVAVGFGGYHMIGARVGDRVVLIAGAGTGIVLLID
jgi:hypothetical protein